jgi:hypothetical protein
MINKIVKKNVQVMLCHNNLKIDPYKNLKKEI